MAAPPGEEDDADTVQRRRDECATLYAPGTMHAPVIDTDQSDEYATTDADATRHAPEMEDSVITDATENINLFPSHDGTKCVWLSIGFVVLLLGVAGVHLHLALLKRVRPQPDERVPLSKIGDVNFGLRCITLDPTFEWGRSGTTYILRGILEKGHEQIFLSAFDEIVDVDSSKAWNSLKAPDGNKYDCVFTANGTDHQFVQSRDYADPSHLCFTAKVGVLAGKSRHLIAQGKANWIYDSNFIQECISGFSNPALTRCKCMENDDEDSPRYVYKDRRLWIGGADPPYQIPKIEVQKVPVAESNKHIAAWKLGVKMSSLKKKTPMPVAPYTNGFTTNIFGRGDLGLYGPNPAADVVLTRLNTNTKKFEILLILRDKTPIQWAVPGGMHESGLDARSTALKELAMGNELRDAFDKDDATVMKEKLDKLKVKWTKGSKEMPWKNVDEFKNSLAYNYDLSVSLRGCMPSKPIYMGMMDDPRNTDTSWMQTQAFWTHCNECPLPAHGLKSKAKNMDEICNSFHLHADTGASDAQWAELNAVQRYINNKDASRKTGESEPSNDEVGLFASHAYFLQPVVDRLRYTISRL